MAFRIWILMFNLLNSIWWEARSVKTPQRCKPGKSIWSGEARISRSLVR